MWQKLRQHPKIAGAVGLVVGGICCGTTLVFALLALAGIGGAAALIWKRALDFLLFYPLLGLSAWLLWQALAKPSGSGQAGESRG